MHRIQSLQSVFRPKHMEAYPADDTVVFDGADTTVKNTWTGYVSDGDAVLAEPEDYITLR